MTKKMRAAKNLAILKVIQEGNDGTAVANAIKEFTRSRLERPISKTFQKAIAKEARNKERREKDAAKSHADFDAWNARNPRKLGGACTRLLDRIRITEADLNLSTLRLRFLEHEGKCGNNWASCQLRHLLSYWDSKFPCSNDTMRAHAVVEGILMGRDPLLLLKAARRKHKEDMRLWRANKTDFPGWVDDQAYQKMSEDLCREWSDENTPRENIANMCKAMGADDRRTRAAAKAIIRTLELIYPY